MRRRRSRFQQRIKTSGKFLGDKTNPNNRLTVYFLARLFQTNHASSPKEEDDLINGGWPGGWHKPKDADSLGEFSAICFLTARYLSDLIEAETGSRPTIGLIESSVGGTRFDINSSG